MHFIFAKKSGNGGQTWNIYIMQMAAVRFHDSEITIYLHTIISVKGMYFSR